jgi:(S)-ureidoglycine aminohydrolase
MKRLAGQLFLSGTWALGAGHLAMRQTRAPHSGITQHRGETMKAFLTLISFALLLPTAFADGGMVPSRAYDWQEFGEPVSTPGQTSQVFEGASDAFSYLYVAVTSIEAGASYSLPRDNAELEALLIMKAGKLSFETGNEQKTMGPGSIALLMPREKPAVDNKSSEAAIVYVVMWRARNFPGVPMTPPDGGPASHLIDWNDVEYVESETRGRRNFIREPTVMMEQFEMHVTTLKEGITSHPPHTHVDEEILLVRHGTVEEHIDGGLHRVGAGSLIFLRSMVSHGISNVGEGPAEYYAFRWVPKKK